MSQEIVGMKENALRIYRNGHIAIYIESYIYRDMYTDKYAEYDPCPQISLPYISLLHSSDHSSVSAAGLCCQLDTGLKQSDVHKELLPR
jgi:hypothetical protein